MPCSIAAGTPMELLRTSELILAIKPFFSPRERAKGLLIGMKMAACAGGLMAAEILNTKFCPFP